MIEVNDKSGHVVLSEPVYGPWYPLHPDFFACIVDLGEACRVDFWDDVAPKLTIDQAAELGQALIEWAERKRGPRP